MEVFYFLIVLTIILVYISLVKKRHPKFPPGPTGLSFLGNVHQMGKRPALAFKKWRAQYGSIFSIKLGPDDAVVISDPKLIRELFSNNASNGRVQNHVFMEVGGGSFGIASAEGESWNEQKTFVLQKLRQIGISNSSMEDMILFEAQGVLEWLDKNKDIPISTDRAFHDAVANSLWSIITGGEGHWKDLEGYESKITILREFREAVLHSVTTGLMFAPFLKYIIPVMSGWERLTKASSDLRNMCEESVVRHKATLDVNHPRDLIDHYIIKIGKTVNEESSFFKQHGEKNLKAVVGDILVAGNGTTSTTLLWTLLYLCCHQTAQQKLIDEIQRVVGNSRHPTLKDRPNLPYTEAVMLEVFRISAVLPIAVPHRMLQDQMFHDYFLPKNTIIIPDLESCLNSPEYWGDPENFRPERFLSEDGRNVIHNDALIPFSVGKRQCIGQTFVRDTCFLMTTLIFQRLSVWPDPEHPKPDLGTEGGFANRPKPFRVVMKELPC